MKYPEFRDFFKNTRCKWYGGHLVEKDGLYYKLVKTESGKVLKSYTYAELSEMDKNKIKEIDFRNEEDNIYIRDMMENLAAKNNLIAFVKKYGCIVDRSNQSESEYWYIKSNIDGLIYKVRISSHVHPTGSMTDLVNRVLDTTDFDCKRFLKILGI